MWENVDWEAKTTKLVSLWPKGTLNPALWWWAASLTHFLPLQSSLKCYLQFTVWSQSKSWNFISANRKRILLCYLGLKVLISSVDLLVTSKIRSVLLGEHFISEVGKSKQQMKKPNLRTQNQTYQPTRFLTFTFLIKVNLLFCQKYKINNSVEGMFHTFVSNLQQRWWLFLTTLP